MFYTMYIAYLALLVKKKISFSATGGTRKKTTLRLPSPVLGKWSNYFNKILNCDNFNI